MITNLFCFEREFVFNLETVGGFVLEPQTSILCFRISYIWQAVLVELSVTNNLDDIAMLLGGGQ